MNLVKKILVVHGDPKIKRQLVLALADAGYDLRAYTAAAPALKTLQVEWFDLAIVDTRLPGAEGFAFVQTLKQIQPTVPIVLLVAELELPLIVQGIRMGLADVMSSYDDLPPLVRRVHALLRPGTADVECDGLSANDLAAVEAVLDRAEAVCEEVHTHDPFGGSTADLRQELLRGVRERALLESKAERLFHEKAALEAELKTLLAQNADALRLQAELAELQSERERALAAQLLIDEKARALTETRETIARERRALEEERRLLTGSAPAAAFLDERANADAERDQERQRLKEGEDRLREEAARLRQETMQIAQERRRWHDDLDLLRAQEDNLRSYEGRLRALQGQLEADRVLWFQTRTAAPAPVASAAFSQADEAGLRAAWEKLQRASELLEAERSTFRDERMGLRELQEALRKREERVRLLEARARPPELRAEAAPAVESAAPGSDVDAPRTTGAALKSLTRAPFEIARSFWSLGREVK